MHKYINRYFLDDSDSEYMPLCFILPLRSAIYFLIALIMAGSVRPKWCSKMTPILLLQMISRRFQQSSCNNYYHLFHYQNALLRSQRQKIDFTHGGLGYSSQYVFVFFFFFLLFGCACSFFKKHLGFDIINNVLHPK